MRYKIKQLAKIAGVSVRTLHFYDEIGLLKPSGVSDNGYRYYEKPKLFRLQQILFYRELDFPLDKIKEILDSDEFNQRLALEGHKLAILRKKERLNKLIKTLDNTIKHMDKQSKINDEELYDPFRDEDAKKYQPEAKLRWGDTEAYKQSMSRVKKLTKAEMEKIKKEGIDLTEKIAGAMDLGPEHADVQSLISEHYKGIRFFYDCPIEMYGNLGKMYVNDQRFKAYYEKFRPGLAEFMAEAIAVFCKNRGKA